MPEPASAHEPYYRSAEPLVPHSKRLDAVGNAALECDACHLHLCGTQTVFGDGPQEARVMIVGEAPGDKEDLAGRPFVGPAGKLLDAALEEAGIDRKEVYITNAVKHFKWEPGPGGRRIHGKPNRKEVDACRPWLDAEIALIQPEVIVCMGATAAQALLGASFRLTQHRGEFLPSQHAPFVIATKHPAAILRAPEEEDRERGKAELISDLRLVANALAGKAPRASKATRGQAQLF